MLKKNFNLALFIWSKCHFWHWDGSCGTPCRIGVEWYKIVTSQSKQSQGILFIHTKLFKKAFSLLTKNTTFARHCMMYSIYSVRNNIRQNHTYKKNVHVRFVFTLVGWIVPAYAIARKCDYSIHKYIHCSSRRRIVMY